MRALSLLAVLLFTGAAHAAETCTVTAPLKMATEPVVGPKRTIWRLLPKKSLVEVIARDGDSATVVVSGVRGTVDANELDLVCTLPIEPLEVPLPPATPVPAVKTESPAPKINAVSHPRVIVLGLHAAGLDDATRASLDDSLTTEVRRYTRMEVVTPAEVRAVVETAAIDAAIGCDDAACIEPALTKVGVTFSAHRVVSGSVELVGAKKRVQLRLIDLVNDKILARVSQDVAGDPAPASKKATAALFGVAGRITIWDQPANADVFLDGVAAGRTPVGELFVAKPGRHLIAVEGAGLTRWQETVDVAGGAAVDVRAKNAPIESLESDETLWRTGAGGLALGAVLAATGAGVLYFNAVQSDKRLDAVDLRTATQPELDVITGDTLGNFLGASALGVASAALIGTAAAVWFWNPSTEALANDS